MFAHVVTIFRANKCQNLSDEGILRRGHIYHFVFFLPKKQFNITRQKIYSGGSYRYLAQHNETLNFWDNLGQKTSPPMTMMQMMMTRQSWEEEVTTDDYDDDGDETILGGRSHHRWWWWWWWDNLGKKKSSPMLPWPTCCVSLTTPFQHVREADNEDHHQGGGWGFVV